MKTLCRMMAVATFAATVAAPAFAALDKYKDWDKGPELLYFATDDEKAAFRKLATDDEAEKFIALFWARRDPDLKTPQNEFKDRVEALVKLADERFALRGRRGSLTERGKVLIVLGPPKQIVSRQISSSSGAENPQKGDEPQIPGPRTIQYTFIYEEDRIPAFAGAKKLEIVVENDQARGAETLMKASQFAALQKKAVEAALVNPALKEPPVYMTREQYEAEQKSRRRGGEGSGSDAGVRAALEAAIARPPGGPLVAMPIAFRDGATRLMLQLSVPAASVTGPGDDEARPSGARQGRKGRGATRRGGRPREVEERPLREPGDRSRAGGLRRRGGARRRLGRRDRRRPPDGDRGSRSDGVRRLAASSSGTTTSRQIRRSSTRPSPSPEGGSWRRRKGSSTSRTGFRTRSGSTTLRSTPSRRRRSSGGRSGSGRRGARPSMSRGARRSRLPSRRSRSPER